MGNEAIFLKSEHWEGVPCGSLLGFKQVSKHRAEDFGSPLLVGDIEFRMAERKGGEHV